MMGAALTVIIALVTIGFQLTDPVYGTGVIGVAIWYALAILCFAVYGRHTLVFSPEEEFAVQHRESNLLSPSERGPHVVALLRGKTQKPNVGKELRVKACQGRGDERCPVASSAGETGSQRLCFRTSNRPTQA